MDNLCFTFDITCGQNSAIGRNQVRRELNLHWASGQRAELLIKLTQMPMRAAHCIGICALRQFGM